MLYKDFDIVLIGAHIRITPMIPSDEEPYARLMFGSMYDGFTERLGHPPETGLPKILAHEASDETHAIRPLSSDAFIGWIALQRDEEGRPDIGISLVPQYQNKGCGPEAIRLYSNYLHQAYGLDTVYLRVHETNHQSQRAMEKMGAVLDKTIPDPKEVAILEKLKDKLSYPPMNVHYYHLDLPIVE